MQTSPDGKRQKQASQGSGLFGSGFGAKSDGGSSFNSPAVSAPAQPASNPFQLGTTSNATGASPFSGSLSSFGAKVEASAASGFQANSVSAPASNPFQFGGNKTADASSSSLFSPFSKPTETAVTKPSTGFGQTAESPASPAFSIVNKPAETPAANPFGGFAKTTETPASKPSGPFGQGVESASPKPFTGLGTGTDAPAASPFNMFGQKTATSAPASTSSGQPTTTPTSNAFGTLFGQKPSAAPSESPFTQTTQTSAPSLFSGLKTSTAPASGSSTVSAQSSNPFNTSSGPSVFATTAPVNQSPSPFFSPFGKDTAAPAASTTENAPTTQPKTPPPQQSPQVSFTPAGEPKSSGFSIFSKPNDASTTASPSKTTPFASTSFNNDKPNSQPSEASTMPALTGFTASQPAAKPFSSLNQSVGTPPAQDTGLQTQSNSGSMFQNRSNAQSSASTTGSLPKLPMVKPMPGISNPLDFNPEQQPPEGLDEYESQRWRLTSALHSLNLAFLEKLRSAHPLADWTQLSKWHFDLSSAISAKIIELRKERALALGVTGTESSLSVKRKVEHEPEETRAETGTPSKKQRNTESATANIFANALSKSAGPGLSSGGVSAVTAAPKQNFSASTTAAPLFSLGNASSANAAPSKSLFGEKSSAPNAASGPSFSFNKTATPPAPTGFSAAPATFNSSSSGSAPAAPSAPVFSPFSSSAPAPGSSAKPPAVESASSNDGASKAGLPKFSVAAGQSVFSQFAKKAEETEAKLMQKAKDEDWDSDEESEEQWEARYRREQAEKKAKAKEKTATSAPSFMFQPSSNASSDAESTTSSIFAPKPTNGQSKSLLANSTTNAGSGNTSNGLFSSRNGSPSSVFDAPPPPVSGSHNIFGHISSGPESGDQDETEDEEGTEEATEGVTEEATEESGGDSQAGKTSGSTTSSRPATALNGSTSQSEEESFEDVMRQKKQEKLGQTASAVDKPTSGPPKKSLFERITRDPPADKEAATTEESNATLKTPAKSNPFASLTPGFKFTSPTTFGGDQTFKPNQEIKFSQSTGSNVLGSGSSAASPFSFSSNTNKATGINFSFGQPASSSATPSLLAPSTPATGAVSAFGTPVPSRAHTPFSADESSKQADDEEGANDAQVALYTDLTDEERAQYDTLFHTEIANAKELVTNEESKATEWKSRAKGPLWILKNKKTGVALFRMRILPSGSMPVNCNILPKISAKAEKKMVKTPYAKVGGAIGQYVIMFRTPELAKEFADVHNANAPK